MSTAMIEVPRAVNNPELVKWVDKMVVLCQPEAVYWCDGSQEKYDSLCNEMVERGTFIRLNLVPMAHVPGPFVQFHHRKDCKC